MFAIRSHNDAATLVEDHQRVVSSFVIGDSHRMLPGTCGASEPQTRFQCTAITGMVWRSQDGMTDGMVGALSVGFSPTPRTISNQPRAILKLQYGGARSEHGQKPQQHVPRSRMSSWPKWGTDIVTRWPCMSRTDVPETSVFEHDHRQLFWYPDKYFAV